MSNKKQATPSSPMRLPKTNERYYAARARVSEAGCPFCSEQPLETFRYWKIHHNEYPYDKVFKTSHLLLPKRHTPDFDDLNWRERREFFKLRRELLGRYDVLLENASPRRTQHHFHMHLLTYKD